MGEILRTLSLSRNVLLLIKKECSASDLPLASIFQIVPNRHGFLLQMRVDDSGTTWHGRLRNI